MWTCPKCGRTFRRTEQSHYCGKAPETIEEYIQGQPEEVQLILRQLQETIHAAIPKAKEKISWSMPTFWKGRTRDEVQKVTAWLTGYTNEQLEQRLESDITYGDFFRNAPALNPVRKQIKGSVCGVKVETIQDPLMQEIRYLDKLVDELAKGKPMEIIMR